MFDKNLPVGYKSNLSTVLFSATSFYLSPCFYVHRIILCTMINTNVSAIHKFNPTLFYQQGTVFFINILNTINTIPLMNRWLLLLPIQVQVVIPAQASHLSEWIIESPGNLKFHNMADWLCDTAPRAQSAH